jgi:LPS sulfotransferase NodH
MRGEKIVREQAMVLDHEERYLPKNLYPMGSHHMAEIEATLALRSATGTARLREVLRGVRTVFLCFTNRVGSNLLTDILDQAGFGVRVAQEDFNSSTVLTASKNHNFNSFSEYLAFLVEITKKNDTCFWKIGAAQLLWLANRGFISDFMPDSKYVFVRRRDKIAQAVSLYIKNKTGQYLADQPRTVTEEPQFDKNGIARELMWILDNEKIFTFFFTLHNVTALDIWYEGFIASPRASVLQVTKHCGFEQSQWVQPADVDLGRARVRRQGTELNAAFCAAMRREFAIEQSS